MENIELVIRMPEDEYRNILLTGKATFCTANAIEAGTLLPKGHKRLIEDNFDVGPVFNKEGNRVGYKYVTQEDLKNALTIVEADKNE